MKFKLALTAFVVAAATVLFSWGSAGPAQAQPALCSPGVGINDYCFAALVDTSPTNPDTHTILKLGTDGGTAAPPTMSFFTAAVTTFSGVAPEPHKSQPLGIKVGEIGFSIQTNIDLALDGNILTSGAVGQRPACGAPGTLFVTAPDFNMYNAISDASAPTVGDLESHDPDPASTPSGMFKGVTHEPSWYPALIGAGVLPPRALHVGRSFGVAVSPAGQTSVNFLTLGPIPSTTTYATVVILSDPIAGFNPDAQTATTCPPFESTVHTLGTAADGVWSGGTVTGGQTRQMLNTAGFYQFAFSSGNNLDSDTAANGNPLWNPWDNCKTVPNDSQAASPNNGIGDACRSGQGYVNVLASAVTNASVGCTTVLTGTLSSSGSNGTTEAVTDGSEGWATCQDASQDGVLNIVDNCPFASNPDQLDSDSDGIGDACDPAPSIKGDGQGYPPNGTYFDRDDICRQDMDASGGMSAPLCFNRDLGLGYEDSANNGTPDFLNLPGAPCVQDHKSDSNDSGYSDSDEMIPQLSGDRVCTGSFPPGSVVAAGAVRLGNALQECPGRNTTALRNHARADVDVNGQVNILDVSLVAGQFGANIVTAPNSDHRHARDLDRNGQVNILDVSIAAGFFGTNVPPC